MCTRSRRGAGDVEVELKERKHRIEDAVRNAKAAVEDGIVAGGGVALLQAGAEAFAGPPGRRPGRTSSGWPWRRALQDAASIAALFLTTEAVVADKPEKDKAPAGGPGAGDMDF